MINFDVALIIDTEHGMTAYGTYVPARNEEYEDLFGRASPFLVWWNKLAGRFYSWLESSARHTITPCTHTVKLATAM